MNQPVAAPHRLDVAPSAVSPMDTILEEQRRAVAYLLANPGDRSAAVWLEDWIAEEVLLRLESMRLESSALERRVILKSWSR